MSNLFTETKEVLTSAASALEKVADKVLGNGESSSVELNAPIEEKRKENPFSSGFDKDHPMPTYDQLRNAGFSDHLAKSILYGESHTYSQKELYHCLYESKDPVKAYNDMMDAKVKAHIAKSDELIKSIESELGIKA